MPRMARPESSSDVGNGQRPELEVWFVVCAFHVRKWSLDKSPNLDTLAVFVRLRVMI